MLRAYSTYIEGFIRAYATVYMLRYMDPCCNMHHVGFCL